MGADLSERGVGAGGQRAWPMRLRNLEPRSHTSWVTGGEIPVAGVSGTEASDTPGSWAKGLILCLDHQGLGIK